MTSDHSAAWLNDYLRLAVGGSVLVAGSKHYPGRPSMQDRYPGRKIVGADMQDGEGVNVVCDLEEPVGKFTGRFAHVDCCSVLEHSRRPWAMAENLTSYLKPNGTILLTVPFVWRVHAYPSDYFRFTIEGVRSLFPRVEWLRMDYVSDRIMGDRVPAIMQDDYPYLARTEVFAFGSLK